VGRLVLRAGEEVGKHAEIVRDIIQLLNRLGEGNAVKFFRALDFEKYTAELAGQWRKLTQRLDDVIGGVLRRAHFVIPDGMVKRLEQLQAGIRDLKQIGEHMIPDSLKELNRRLKTLQKHVYEGEWHEIPEALKSATRETEARLVETEVEGKPKKVWSFTTRLIPRTTRGCITTSRVGRTFEIRLGRRAKTPGSSPPSAGRSAPSRFPLARRFVGS
jgi:hypothetical protein